MISLLPFDRRQTATASPEESTARLGEATECPVSERLTGVCQPPPAASRVEVWRISLLPFERPQIATVSPAASSASLTLAVFPPVAESVAGGVTQAGVALALAASVSAARHPVMAPSPVVRR